VKKHPRLVCSAALITLLLAGGASALADVSGLPAWDTVPSASPGNSSRLLGVADLGGGAVWAVGTTSRAPLAQHWNGTAFSRVPIAGLPNRKDVLEGVDGVGPENVWAVGHADSIDSVGSRSLIYHWDGTAWTRVPSPNFGDSETRNDLFAVAAVSGRDVWAVGTSVDISSFRPITLHWDGTAWRKVPNPCGGGLNGVTALDSNNVWAVGGRTICHWNGLRWSAQVAPAIPGRSIDLQDVDGVTGALWTVGREYAQCGEGVCSGGLILRRSRTGWVREASGYNLDGVTAIAANDAWAVGTWAFGPLLLHRDDSSWEPAPSPDNDGLGHLAGVSASGPKSLWAVGKQLVNADGTVENRTLALHAPSARSGAIAGDTAGGHVTVSWFGPETGSTESDQFGDFLVGGLTAGRYDFIASVQGCTPARRQIDIVPGTTIALSIVPRC
jgi:hypothetical protein